MIKTVLTYSKPIVLLLILLVSNILLAQTPLSGTYAIDPTGNGDYVSFTDAVIALDTFGVSGPTVFEAEDATYNEQLKLSTYAGMDSVNTVTFRSQSGNPDSVILAYSSTGTTDNYVVKMFDADYFSFEDMAISNINTSYSHVFDMWGSDNISIDNCKITSNATNYFTSVLNIYYNNNGVYAGCNNFSLTNNEINGGHNGLYYYLDTVGVSQNVVIENNKFVNQFGSGVRIFSVNGLQFNNNFLTSTSYNAYAYGFFFWEIIHGTVSNNFVKGNAAWPAYGMYFAYAEGDSSNNLSVFNNRISMPNSFYGWGMYAHSNHYVDYSNNSIFMSGASGNVGLRISTGSNIRVKNNIVKVDGAGATAFSFTGTPIAQLDYNSYSAPNGKVGVIMPPGPGNGVSYATLSAWQGAAGFDSNSVVVNNAFVDPIQLKVCSDSLWGVGICDSLMNYDFEGEPRQNPPCIGADEFMPISEFGFDDQTLCNGDTLEFSQYYFDTVVWNTVDTTNTIIVTSPGLQSVAVYGECGLGVDTFNVIAPQMVSVSDTNLCEGTSTNLETGVSNATYLWNDGSTDSTFLVDSAQVVWVSVLDTFGCVSSDTAVITQSFNVNLPDSTIFCEGDSVGLDAVILGVYSWNTGDTTQSIFVSSIGNYSVTVIDQNCTSSDSIFVDETLNPKAIFSDSVDHYTVVFTNFSTYADSFLWDFGDGTTSNQEHPIHIFPWSGSSRCFLVQLVVYNQCGTDTTSAIIGIDGYNSPTDIIKSVSNWTVYFGLNNAFSNYDFYWDFGDGSISYLSNPTHTYSSANAYECYTVKLVYTDCGDHYFEKDIAVGNYPASNPCSIIDGVEDNQLSTSGIEIYPNPSNGVFNMVINSEQPSNLNIEILDARGTLIFTQEYGVINGEVSRIINLDDAAQGIYLMKVTLGDESTIYRLLVN